MAGYRRLGALAGLGAALIAAVPAQAAGCWADREVSAAHVRQMQTLLMVAALRCRAGGIDIVADYDGFVTAQRDAIAAANLVIKQHFAQTGGDQAAYDRFTTALANGYGDDDTSPRSCADAAAMAHEGSASTGDAALARVASARIFPAALPGGLCTAPPATIATADASAPPADAPAPTVMLAAAPPPPPQPRAVSLPADVVAALTVLARYQAAPPAAATIAPTQLAVVAR